RFDAWRRLAGMAGNNLGCILASCGDVEAAVREFLRADAVYPAGISAMLNLATLARDGVASASRSDLASRLEALHAARHEETSLSATGGYVMKPETFFPAGWGWTASGLDYDASSNRVDEALAAAEKVAGEPGKRMVQQAVVADYLVRSAFAKPLVGQYDRAGVRETAKWPASAAPAAANALFESGNRDLAVSFLDRVAGSLPDKSDPAAFDIALARLALFGHAGDAAGVGSMRHLFRSLPASEQYVKANLAVAAAALDCDDVAGAASDYKAVETAVPDATPWLGAIRRAAEALAAADFENAGKAAAKALASGGTNYWPALRLALAVSYSRNDKKAASSAASALVAMRPVDYFAHYVLGSLAMSSGDRASARVHLQASLASRPSLFCLNDLASLMAEDGEPVLAEKFARQALACGGESLAAIHDTLGEALAAQSRWPEALEAFKTATTRRGGDDPRIVMHLAEALRETGDLASAAALIPAIDKGKDAFTIRERERLGALRRAVSNR
ncbi:MAG: hypothetical protein IJ783_05870, partial [Kiritimatiellae bacterium]|nr:hypothetical protein [Kiritimatiellia bacterium]